MTTLQTPKHLLNIYKNIYEKYHNITLEDDEIVINTNDNILDFNVNDLIAVS